MKAKDIAILSFAAGLIALLAYLWTSPSGLKQAPELTVKTIKGEDISLGSLRGRPVLVTFWATSCPGCLEEMPHLIALYEELHPQGLEIIGVAMSYDPPNHVVNLVEQRAVPYPIALDLQERAAQAFGDVRLTPTSFLIAPDGRIVRQKIGEMDMNRLRNTILGLLEQA